MPKRKLTREQIEVGQALHLSPKQLKAARDKRERIRTTPQGRRWSVSMSELLKEDAGAHDKGPEHESDDSLTGLTSKHHAALVIRKITKFGFPIYVGIITDDDLNSLDRVVVNCVQDHLRLWKSNKLQDKRNLAGALTDALTGTFPSTEGVAITLFIDKSAVSSLFGDFMNHAMCRQEYYFLLNMSTGV